MSTEKKNYLDVLFPVREVTICKGFTITLKPIALPDLSKVMGSFLRVARLHNDGISEADMAILAMQEIINMLPFCTECPIDQIPHYAFPDLMEAFLDLNVTEDLVKKWTALTGQLIKKKEGIEGQGGAKAVVQALEKVKP